METRSCFFDGDAQRIGACGALIAHFNRFPIGVGHSLFAPPEHREELRLEDLESVVEFAREGPGVVFHNMREAGASKPEHLHFHAYLREGALPLETAPRVVFLLKEGFTMFRVQEYPAYALAVRGPRRAQAAFNILGALGPAPYNLFINHNEVYVIPRAKELPPGFVNAFGALEMAGCVVLSDADRYREVTYRQIWDAIAECGWTAERGWAFERRLSVDLMGVRDDSAAAPPALPELFLG